MQQIVKFEIELFDVRRKSTIVILNDSSYIKSIAIRKDIYLNNTASIVFIENSIYTKTKIDDILRLYNYAKMKLTLTNSGDTSKDMTSTFYFSGFVSSISRNAKLGSNPDSVVTMVIRDYASLLKSTFYTRNLTFLDILNQAIPEFRLLNFKEIFNDESEELISSFYDPNQMGFIFFSFLYYKFFHGILNEYSGNKRFNTVINNKHVFKKFKIFMPFSFRKESMFVEQATNLIIYRQMQGVAFDMFKYLYPEPIFEFNTYETEDAVVLIIRPTPFMSFPDYSYDAKAKDYKVIEYNDFGIKTMKDLNNKASLSTQINDWNSPIYKTIDGAVKYDLKCKELVPTQKETNRIMDFLYNMKNFDTMLIESYALQKSEANVVNMIWTVPVTDTSILQCSGRLLVYAKLEEKLERDQDMKVKEESFSKYIENQFRPGQYSNPVFLWNYKGYEKNNFISGDMNFFGLREFEVRWNYLTMFDILAYSVLDSLNQEELRKIATSSQNTEEARMARDRIFAIDTTKERAAKLAKEGKINSQNVVDPLKDKKMSLNTAINKQRVDAIYQKLGKTIGEISALKGDDINTFLKQMREIDGNSAMNFVSEVNSVVARAYRENEHVYDGVIKTVINLGVGPGQVFQTTTGVHPFFKGYIASSIHTLDFNGSSFRTDLEVSRVAQE